MWGEREREGESEFEMETKRERVNGREGWRQRLRDRHVQKEIDRQK